MRTGGMMREKWRGMSAPFLPTLDQGRKLGFAMWYGHVPVDYAEVPHALSIAQELRSQIRKTRTSQRGQGHRTRFIYHFFKDRHGSRSRCPRGQPPPLVRSPTSLTRCGVIDELARAQDKILRSLSETRTQTMTHWTETTLRQHLFRP